MDNLTVKVNSIKVGNLSKESNEFIYSYLNDNKQDFISLTMPNRLKPYIHNKLHPIFEMHLPEGYLLSIIKKHFSKLTKTDDFGLLKIMSNSIKGRLSYETSKENVENYLTLDDLIHSKNENLFDELVNKFALNSSLSGVQPKILATIKNKITLKIDDYIVKSWGDDYKELAINEFYCMKILKLANIPVPEFYISDDEKLFIMKRFDKIDEQYIGFEDMCVLLGKQRDDKYDGSLEQIVKTIKTFVSTEHRKTSLVQFFKMTYLNYRLRNGDAHLKNFGLLYENVDNIKLSPAYDVVSTTVYIKNDIPALLLLGSKKWWDVKYLERFAIQTCDLTKKEFDYSIQDCENAIRIISNEITNRLQKEKHINKIEILKKLFDTLNNNSIE